MLSLPMPSSEDGSVFTLEEFEKACKQGSFINNDGIGYYGTILEYYPDLPAKPSDFSKGIIDKTYTHVAWFNK